MSLNPTTYLILFLRPENEEHALYLVTGEILLDREATLVEKEEEASLCRMATPFLLPYKEKRLTLALTRPIRAEQITEVADLVATGLLTGFLVRGEIDLGGRVIHNLGADNTPFEIIPPQTTASSLDAESSLAALIE